LTFFHSPESFVKELFSFYLVFHRFWASRQRHEQLLGTAQTVSLRVFAFSLFSGVAQTNRLRGMNNSFRNGVMLHLKL
jgi:hypothetical protein